MMKFWIALAASFALAYPVIGGGGLFDGWLTGVLGSELLGRLATTALVLLAGIAACALAEHAAARRFGRGT